MPRRSDPAVYRRWAERFARFDDGDLTVVEFCRREGVSSPSFYQWRKRLRFEKPSLRSPGTNNRALASVARHGTFLPVVLRGAAAESHVEILLPNGAVVRLIAADRRTLTAAILAASRHSGRKEGEAC